MYTRTTLHAAELYDHSWDPLETVNLATNASYAAVRQQLSAQLHQAVNP